MLILVYALHIRTQSRVIFHRRFQIDIFLKKGCYDYYQISPSIFLLAIIIFCCNALIGQVKIKERIEISPGKIALSFENGGSDNFILPALNSYDFAINGGGGFIESFDNIYNDQIFVPRIGGVINTAYDFLYSHSWYEVMNGLDPWYDTLLVIGPDGKIKNKFGCGDFWDSTGNYVAYLFNQDVYWNDRKKDSLWQILDPTYFPDSTKWGWYPNLRMQIPVKAWEPLRFRLFKAHSGLAMTPSLDFQFTYTYYPSLFEGGTGRITFPCTGNLCNYIYGDIFPMVFDIDSSVTGGSPIIYSDPQPEFYLPDSGMYRVIIGTVKPNVNGTLTLIDTASHVLTTDIRSCQLDTILIGPYAAGTILKFELSGMKQCGGQWDYMSGGIGFENWTDYDFQDAAIWVEYAVKPVDHLELWSTSETIYYGDTLDVDIVPCDSDSLFSPLGYDYKFEFSVELTGETSRYVELIYEDQGSNTVAHIPSNNRRGMGVRLAANKEEPDSVVDLTFRLKAFYIGGGGAASSIVTVPDGQTEIKVQTKISGLNQSKQTLSNKDGKITLSFGSQKREVNRTAAKKLQAMSKQPKKRKIGRILVNDKSKNILPVSYSKKEIKASIMDGETPSACLETEWTMGINPPQEILLGETIYFQAVEDPIDSPEHKKKLLIIPLEKVNERHNPKLSGIKFTVEKREGDKLGVYFDEKKDEDGKDLDSDIIRLVGRYWKEGQKYTVLLKAENSDRNGHMLVEVKRPARLLTPGEIHSYMLTLDVFNNERNIDSVCINYGGLYGVPPQFLKGQMLKESGKITYAGKNAFAPSYRYEPFSGSGQLSKAWKQDIRYNNGLWIVDPIRLAKKMGYGKDVPDHNNVCYMPYPKEPMTVWQILQDHSELEATGSDVSHRIYGSRNSSGIFKFSSPYKTMNSYYQNYLFWGAFVSPVPFTSKYEFARQKMIIFLRDKWHGGMQNMVAQTRLASSYGLLQMMYGTAVGEIGYPWDDSQISPEDFNVTDVSMFYCLEYMKKLLINKLSTSVEESGNWPNGLEFYYKHYIWPTWNTDDAYPGIVYSYTQKFLPQNK